MVNAILANNYRAVNLLHTYGNGSAILANTYRAVNLLLIYGEVLFHHAHFQIAVLHDCESCQDNYQN